MVQRTVSYLVVLTLSVLFPFARGGAEVPVPPPGFTALFNGRDFAGWYGRGHVDPRLVAKMTDVERQALREKGLADMHQHWRIENEELVNDGHGMYLTTDEEFGDIELLIDYKTVPKADSGIYLRGNPQVQIWDWTEEGGKWNLGADKGSGGLWNNSPGAPGKDPLVRADRAFGEWNRFHIIQIGDLTTVYLNGQLVVDHARMENFWDRKSPLWPTGPIQLQTHGGEIRWRNLFVRRIGPNEANLLLAQRDADGFHSVFNGRNLSGWTGAVDGYEVFEGAIQCRPRHGGCLFTDASYNDFVVRFEFQLPPGGNNGLAIRYPSDSDDEKAGRADTAYRGMCELQVLDNSAPQYSTLDARQYHGSAYGMVAARRGFQRPVGTWNFQEVAVQGSTIRVELNGTVILDCDLSTVTEFMANSPHPGKDRTSGHFGFAGHGDSVRFRNIRIRRL